MDEKGKKRGERTQREEDPPVIAVGMRVITDSGMKGIVRYMGRLHFDESEDWVVILTLTLLLILLILTLTLLLPRSPPPPITTGFGAGRGEG